MGYRGLFYAGCLVVRWRSLIIILVLVLIAANTMKLYSGGSTEVSSNVIVIDHDITSNTVWKGGYTYLIVGDVRVFPGVELIVEGGASILFSDASSLEVDGRLFIDGHRDAPVFVGGDENASVWRLYPDSGTIEGYHVEADLLRVTVGGNLSIHSSNISSLVFEPSSLGSCGSTADVLLENSTINLLLFNCSIGLDYFSYMTITGSSIGILQAKGALTRGSSMLTIDNSTIEAMIAIPFASSYSSMIIKNTTIGTIQGRLVDYHSKVSFYNCNISQVSLSNSDPYYYPIGSSSTVLINETSITGNITINSLQGPALENGELVIKESTITGDLSITGTNYALESDSHIVVENSTIKGILITTITKNTDLLTGTLKESTIEINGSSINEKIMLSADHNTTYTLWSSSIEISYSQIGELLVNGKVQSSTISINNSSIGGDVSFYAREERDKICCSNIIINDSTIRGNLSLYGGRTTITLSSINIYKSDIRGIVLKPLDGSDGIIRSTKISIEESYFNNSIHISGNSTTNLALSINKSTIVQGINLSSTLEDSSIRINWSTIGLLNIYQMTGTSLTVHFTNITENLRLNPGEGSNINLSYNWWGDPTGPYLPGIWPGNGAFLSEGLDPVLWTPWLTNPVSTDTPQSGGPVVNISGPNNVLTGEDAVFNVITQTLECELSYYLFYPGSGDSLINTTSSLIEYTYQDPGTYTVAVAAFCNSGLAGLETTIINVSAPQQAPSLTIIAPANNTVINNSQVMISWNISWPYEPGGFGQIQIYVDNELVASLEPYATSYTLNLSDGIHEIKIIAAYMQGSGHAESLIMLKVDTVEPDINVTTNIIEDILSITWYITDENLQEVSVMVNGNTAYRGSRANGTVNTTILEGLNTITIRAVDQAGNTATWTKTITYHAPIQAPGGDQTTTQITTSPSNDITQTTPSTTPQTKTTSTENQEGSTLNTRIVAVAIVFIMVIAILAVITRK